MPDPAVRRATRPARLLVTFFAALFARPAGGAPPPRPAEDWTPFEASLSATGQRQTLKAGSLEAATTRLSGSFVVRRGEGLRKGFRGEALVYGDGGDVGVGTLVLTDDHGDQIFCSLVGDVAKGGTEVRATIRGGTGRYEGIAGRFAFLWRFVVRTPEGDVSGYAEKVGGRYRLPAGGGAGRPEVQR